MAQQPILIVGAGPTGLTAGLELSAFGVPVRIIDKLPEPRTTSRALAVHARTLELLEPRGLTAPMLRLGLKASGANLFSEGKPLAEIALSQIDSRYNFVLLLSQAETERLMREQLASRGVEVERPVELVAVAQVESRNGVGTGGSARAILKHADGRLEEVETPFLISGEGAHSLVRHTLNLKFAGSSIAQRYALADLFIDGPVAADHLSMYLSRHGFTALFPMAEGHFRVIASEPEAEPDESAKTPSLEDVQRLFDRDTHVTARLHDPLWTSWFRINTRMVSSLREGALLFGGDSAHVHSPAGGQGMNTSIQDMLNLGWKLAWVLQGNAAPELLDTYSEERVPVIRQVLRVTEGMTEAVSTEGPIFHQVLTHVAPLLLGTDVVQHRSTSQLSQIAFHYRESSLSMTDAHPGSLRAGDRLPELTVLAQRPSDAAPRPTRLLELSDPTRLTLLLTGGPEPSAPQAIPERAHLQRWGDLLQVVRTRPLASDDEQADTYVRCFGKNAGLFMIRPDAYLGFTGGDTSWHGLLHWLRKWFPPHTSVRRG